MIRLAIVGYGGMAGWHEDKIKSLSGFSLTGIYDIDPARCKVGEAHGLRVFKTPEELGESTDVDAVLVATPNDFHAHYVEFYASYGKHIICEKPACLSVQEFDRMDNAAKKNHVVFTIHQNRRWDKDYLTVGEIIKSGILGKVYRIESKVTGANGIGGWRREKKHGGGMMLDWGVHMIDQICCMLRSPIDLLNCSYSYELGCEVDDGFELDLHFTEGIDVKVVAETNTFVDVPRWVIYGHDGTAIIRNWDVEGEIVVGRGVDEKLKGIKAGNGFTKTMAKRSDDSLTRLTLPDVKEDGFAFYRNFQAACEGKEPQYIKAPEVRRVLQIMEKAAESAGDKKYIKEAI
jgi:predicted dehydrogenase